MMVVTIVVGAFGMLPKGLEKRLEELEIRGRIKTIQITGLLNTHKRPEETYCHLDSYKRPLAKTSLKNLQEVK